MNDQVNIQHNKLMKLDDTMLMYGIYNVETLDKLINMAHEYIMQLLYMKNCLQENTTLHYLVCYTQMP